MLIEGLLFHNNGTTFQFDGKWVQNKITIPKNSASRNLERNRMIFIKERTARRLFNQNILKGRQFRTII